MPAQQIDPNGDKIQLIKTNIPGLEEIYAIKRGVIVTGTPAGFLLTVQNPYLKGAKEPFDTSIDIFNGPFTTQILKTDPEWLVRPQAEKPKSNILV